MARHKSNGKKELIKKDLEEGLLSQIEIAEEYGVSRQYVWQIKHGAR